MSPARKLTVLITGCTPGGMGAALAIVFHGAGHHAYATGRNLTKLSPLAEQGIKTLALDVTSASSIASAVSSVTASLPDGKDLDILVDNAGGIYIMPIADVSLPAAKELFNLNVWSQIAVTQAFLPLLIKATAPTASAPSAGGPTQALIVNHTSVASQSALPFFGIYNASKAALAILSETMRLELSAFGIRVIDLKTAAFRTNIISNNNFHTSADRLPDGSIYQPAREILDRAVSQQDLNNVGTTPEQWAADVAGLLLGKKPSAVIWKGESAMLARVASLMPSSLLERPIKAMSKMDVVEDIIRKSRR